MKSFGGAGVSLLDDYEMKVTPNASAALKLISAT
jgi:hypothetical protein